MRSRPAPGGSFTVTVVVRNPSAEPITITSLTDDIYGNLATRPGSNCGALIGTVLAAGASSAPCTFTGDFAGAAACLIDFSRGPSPMAGGNGCADFDTDAGVQTRRLHLDRGRHHHRRGGDEAHSGLRPESISSAAGGRRRHL